MVLTREQSLQEAQQEGWALEVQKNLVLEGHLVVEHPGRKILPRHGRQANAVGGM